MLVSSAKVEFLWIIFKFRKREEILSSLVYFLCKTWNRHFRPVVVVQWRQSVLTCKIVVLFIKTIAFFMFSLPSLSLDLKIPIKQQRRRRLRKRHLKNEYALLQTLLRFLDLVQFVNCCNFFWSWILNLRGKKGRSRSCVHVLDNTWN